METLKDAKEFNKIINQFKHKPLLLNFYSDSCKPFDSVITTLQKLSIEYNGIVEIKKVDIDINTELTDWFRVKEIPYLVFIKNREIIRKLNELPCDNELRNCLNLLIDCN